MASNVSFPRRLLHDHSMVAKIEEEMASLEIFSEVGSGREYQQTTGVNVTSYSVAMESIHDESTSKIDIL